MDLPEIVIVAVVLAMDASAVSLAAAASGYADSKGAVFRLSFHFALFQFLMPVLGWLSGYGFSSFLSAIDHWIAFGLLLFVGVRMIFSGLFPKKENYRKDPSRGLTMVVLSLATSIDAYAIGISLAMLQVSVLYPSLIIGLTTGLMSVVAIRLGRKLGAFAGQRLDWVGGTILVIIGFRVIISHYI